jgi:viroplasmin and RNaseH domain-containing protein
MLKKTFVLVLILFSVELFAESNFFSYIPSEEEAQVFIVMRSFFKEWNDNKIKVDDDVFAALFKDYLGKDTLHSLLFEAFLRYTKNKNIQNRVLKYIKDNKLESNFTETLKKLYAAKEIKRKIDGKDVIQYVYNNQEYDENINLFWSNEVRVFNHELGLLLFANDWRMITRNDEDDTNRSVASLIYGGGTNSMSIAFRKYSNVDSKNVESKFNTSFL